MTEAAIRNAYLPRLDNQFHIHEEVNGRHFSGKTLTLDAVVCPKKNQSWKNSSVALGIEFKDTVRFSRNYDTKNLTTWLAQCVDYSNTVWDKYGYIYIFTCPSLVDEVATRVMGNPMFVTNFMGQLGIGELKEAPEYGLAFLLHGHHRIWSEQKGVEYGKHYTLKRKFGSR